MFTGIIQAIGKVREPEPLGNGVRLTICAPDLGLDEVRIGDDRRQRRVHDRRREDGHGN